MNNSLMKTPVELLQSFIQIGSVSPDSEVSGTTSEYVGEEKLALAIKALLEPLGVEVELDYVLPNRPNLIARIAPIDGRPRVLLGPHLDTVDVNQMSIEPFEGFVKEGKIWGRGASDTKGPMVAMLCAWIKHLEVLKTAPVAVDFVAFCGEESYQQGSQHFADNYGSDYDFAVVGEPTSLQVVNVSKGALWIKVSAAGKSAHSSKPHLGANAIESLITGLGSLSAVFDTLSEKATHAILGKPTMNIGLINGGSRPNIVPSEAYALVDFRTTPELVGEVGFLKKLEALCEQEDWGVTLSPSSDERFPMEVDPANPYIKGILSTASETEVVGAPWFSDAAWLSRGGIPSVCLGPGSIDQAHTKDEFIKIEDLNEGVAFFETVVKELSKQR